MSEAMRSGDRSSEDEVDLVAFNGYPDLPDEVPNPQRRHRVAAVTVAALTGIAAMLLAAAVAPADDGLLGYLVLVGPLAGGYLIAIGLWDHLVEHRRPQLGSGTRPSPSDALAERIALLLFLGLLWFSPLPASFAAGGPDRIRAGAVGFALLVLLMLLVWLLALGLGRLVRSQAGERRARLTLVFILVFVCAALLGAALPRFEEGMRVAQGGSGWTMSNGIEMVCWGVPREPCERRATFLLRASEAIQPDLAPTMVEIGRPEGDRVCDGIPMVAMTCWRID